MQKDNLVALSVFSYPSRPFGLKMQGLFLFIQFIDIYVQILCVYNLNVNLTADRIYLHPIYI